MEYKYDVFISYSRKDYVDDENSNNVIPNNAISAIIDTLKQNSISYWYDREGISYGDDYAERIFKAIHESKVFLFVSSENSNSDESKWPKREISEANIYEMPIIPCKIDKTQYHKSMYPILKDKNYYQYYGKKNELKELVRSINKHKNDVEEKQRKEKENSRQEEFKKKINEFSSDYQIQATKQDAIRNDIIELFKKMGIEYKTCPVCNKSISIDAIYCERCGWHFPALPSLTDEKRLLNQDFLSTIKENWNLIKQKAASKQELDKVKNDIKALKKELEKKTNQNKKFQEKIDSLKLKHQEDATVLNNTINDLQTQIADLKQQKEDIEKEYQEKIDSIEQQNTDLRTQLKEEREKNKPSSKTIDTQTAPISQKKKKTFKTKAEIYDLINDKCIPNNFRASVYPSDPVNIVNLSKLISILCDEYGLEFNKNDFKNCRKIFELYNVIAEKAGL